MTESRPSENPYFIDAESPAEMARLTQQDRVVTKYMGGLIAEHHDLSRFRDVLDIACGPGGWVLDLAFEHPEIEVVGIDSSQRMIDYARTQAQVQDLENTRFKVMNALKPLEFPDHSFDLVNARMIHGFVPKTVWPQLLMECQRILKPGGIIRLTQDEKPITNSLAFEEYTTLGARAIYLAGRSFSPNGQLGGVPTMLWRLLRDAGYQNIQYQAHAMNFSLGSDAHKSMYHNWMVAFKLLQPFMVKMGVIGQKEVESLYQHVLTEVQQDQFCGLWFFLTAWGETPN